MVFHISGLRLGIEELGGSPWVEDGSHFRNPPWGFFSGDPRLSAAFEDPSSVEWWNSSCLTSLADFLQGDKFVSFAQLWAQMDIPARELYKYMQLRHFFQTYYASTPSDSNTSFESLCHTSPRQKGLISAIYKSIEGVGAYPTLKHRTQYLIC